MKTVFIALLVVISVIVTILFLPVYYLLRLFKGERKASVFASKVAKEWGRFVFRLTGSTLEIKGAENLPKDKTLLLVSNHQSDFDIPLLLGYIDTPFGFIAKIELSRIPIFSRWMKYFKCVFIDRGHPRKSMEAILEAIENINNGYTQLIFPEGTRSRGGEMLKFKPGSLKIATKTKCIIVPITLDGTYNIFNWKFHVSKTHVKLTIHKPINVAELTDDDTQALSDNVHDIIESALEK